MYLHTCTKFDDSYTLKELSRYYSIIKNYKFKKEVGIDYIYKSKKMRLTRPNKLAT